MKFLALLLMILAEDAVAQSRRGDSAVPLRVGAGAGIVSFDSAAGLSGPSLEIGARMQRPGAFVGARLRYHHLVGSDSTIATTRLGRSVLTGMVELGLHFTAVDESIRPFGAVGASVITFVESRSGFFLEGTPREQRMFRFAPHVSFGAEHEIDDDLTLSLGATVAYALGADAPFRWVGGLSVGLSTAM